MDPKKVTILYDAEEDTVKAEAVARGEKFPLVYEHLRDALVKRGHQVSLMAAGLDIKKLVTALDKDSSDIVFNLCESVGGVTHHEQNVAAVLELMGKPFTGSSAVGISLAQDKALAKKLFQFHGIKFPRFSVFDAGMVEWSDELRFPLIVKPLNQDSSIGIDNRAIVTSSQELTDRISYLQRELRCPVLVEEFIEGRELYVGVLGNESPEALPILEWDFSKLPEETPRIASAEAKWDKESEAYNAPQCFPDDIPKLVYQEIQRTAVEAFKALKLRDYARVDYRLRYFPKGTVMLSNPRSPKRGSPPPAVEPTESETLVSAVQEVDAWEYYLIEVNPNPHLERGAEFALAARKKGLSYLDIAERIMEAALRRHGIKL